MLKAVQEVMACWELCTAMLLPAPTRFRECTARDKRPATGLGLRQTRSLGRVVGAKKEFFKMTEQSGKIYENKGALWKSQG